jgi:hypothetical protein
MSSDWIIVCPDRIKNVFSHLIMCFEYSIRTTTIYNVEDILKTTNKKVILLGAQELCKYKEYSFFLFSNEVYLYNTEQLQSRNWDYMIVKSFNIKQWWDYSLVNIEYLKENCFPVDIKHIYFGYSPILELPLKEELNKNIITFFGTHHERRYALCNKLQENLIKKGSNIIVKYNTSGELYKDLYDNYISSHMIYLNVHYYTPSILEIVRIVPLLCQGHLVITEHSDDKQLDAMFNPYVIWLEDVLENIDILLDRIKTHDNKKLKEEFKNNLEFNISNFI